MIFTSGKKKLHFSTRPNGPICPDLFLQLYRKLAGVRFDILGLRVALLSTRMHLDAWCANIATDLMLHELRAISGSNQLMQLFQLIQYVLNLKHGSPAYYSIHFPFYYLLKSLKLDNHNLFE